MRQIPFVILLVPIIAVFAVCLSVPLTEVHWTFDLLAQFLQPAFVVAVVGALVALATRRKWLAAAGGVGAVAAFALAWPWTQMPPAPQPDAAHFRVLLFNVWKHNASGDDLAKAILAVDADVVVLLEMRAPIREKLRPLDAHYSQRFECWQTQGCDVLIFSRLPIKEPHLAFAGESNHAAIAWFETNAAGCAMNIFATHLTRPFPHLPATAQAKEADDLATAISGWPGPKIVVGDFNGVPWGHVVKTVAARANLHVSLGATGTWPSLAPPPFRLAIDQAMASEGLAFISRKVLDLPGSDHAAVLTDIAIADRTRCW